MASRASLLQLVLPLPLWAAAQLNMQTWPNTAFAPPSAAVASLVANVSASGAPPAFADFSTVRFTGTIVDNETELVQFTANTDGGVRLWVDDHLVINDGVRHNADGKPSLRQAFLKIPFVARVPQPFRLEYSRYAGAAPPTIELMWEGNVTMPSQVVPSVAFSPVVAAAEAERVALRDGLINQDCHWQTYNNPTMGSHVNMPSGFYVDATLADSHGGNTIGNIIVFRRSNPALSLAGLHSHNGSDYTQISLSRWGTRVCDVNLETTVVNGGTDLWFLASSNGSDCAHLLLIIRPSMMDERYGTFSMGADQASFQAVLPGFAGVTVRSVGASPVAFPNASLPYLALPLDAGSGVGSGVVGYVTGSGPLPSIASMQSSIAAARVIVQAVSAPYGDLSEVYEAMSSILLWNTMFTPVEGVVTPVSRGWDFGSGYVIFDWDNLFLSFMASLEAGTLKDIAYANLIQIVQARTLLGFVPNFASGPHVSFDRTEPQIGAVVVRKIYDKWRDEWLIDLLYGALRSWNEWVWVHRRGEGSLSGPDGHADLIVLGSDPTDPPCDVGGFNNLQAARYESGLDNSPMYDGSDECGKGGPVCFDNVTTHHMQLYDVGMTALYLSDTEALIYLAQVAGRFDDVPVLQQRLDRVRAAMNAHMWDAEAGMYTNVLYNGSFYKRYAPTSYFPLISGSASDAQADAMMALFTSPLGFCFNRSYTPDVNAAMLVQWYDGRDNAACLTDDCIRDNVDARFNYIRVEGVALLPAGGPAPGLVALNLYYSAANDDFALVTGAAPAAGYALVRQEGFCWAQPPETPSAWPVSNITLWWSPSRKDYKTCGGNICEVDSGPDYVQQGGVQCHSLDGSTPASMPCKFGGSSIARGDPAFFDNDYWRGRIWGPHLQLMYWGLERYDHVPSVHAARQELVAMGKNLMLQVSCRRPRTRSCACPLGRRLGHC